VPAEELRAAVAALSADALAEERWFGAKDGAVGPVELLGSLDGGGGETLLALRVGGDTYLVPAAVRDGRIVEAEGELWRTLAAACLDGATLAGDGLVLAGAAGPVPGPPAAVEVRPLGVDQSNTSVVLGDRTVLKCYRRVAPGEHPEIELTRWLSGRGLACLPAVHGSATVSLAGGEPAGALLLQDFVADGRDGWLAAEAELGGLLDGGDPAAAARAPGAWAPGIGRATAELHALLAAAEEPALAPRRATPADVDRLAAVAEAELVEALACVTGEAAAELAAAAPALRARFALFAEVEPPLLTRVHGDLHLGQFLLRAGGVPALVDLEGEPTKSAGERRRLASPLRDLAGLLRSVDHAAHWVCLSRGEEAGPVAAAWIASARAAIGVAYEARLAELGAPLRVDPRLLAAFEAEKGAYEFVYAARYLPSWLEVPRRALPAVIAL